MHLPGRMTAAVACLFIAASSCALDLKYGRYFTVSGITQADGAVQLPLEKKKYKNIKVLSKKLYQTLLTCDASCVYEPGGVSFASVDYRVPPSNKTMLIADVDFNDDLAITFLIFKNKTGLRVSAPSDFAFTDKRLEKDVTEYLKKLAGDKL